MEFKLDTKLVFQVHLMLNSRYNVLAQLLKLVR